MATVRVRLLTVQNKALTGGTQPVLDPVPVQSQNMTSSGTSTQSTVVVPADAENLYWRIDSDGGAVWLKFGDNPTAAADDDWKVADQGFVEFSARKNQKVAVIDA